jgi:transposase
MFFRKVVSKSGGKEYAYVKLIENYREGNKVKQKVIANLGNLENFTPEKVQSLISGLSRICGVDHQNQLGLETKKVLHYGDVLILDTIWDHLELSKHLATHTREHSKKIDVPLLTKLLVMNQIIKPKSGRAISDWCQNLYLPELETKQLRCDDFYEALHRLVEAKEPLEKALLMQMRRRNLRDSDPIYCQLIRGFFENNIKEAQSPKQIFLTQAPKRKQVDMAILVNRKGIPVGHKTFTGYFNDGETVPHRIMEIQDLYEIERCVFVSDQNTITEENLNLLHALGYEYVAGIDNHRLNSETAILQEEMKKSPATFNNQYLDNLWYKEIINGEIRYLLCYTPQKAAQKKEVLENKLNDLEKELTRIKNWVRKRCDIEAKETFYRATKALKDPLCKRYFNFGYDENTKEFLFERKQNTIDSEYLLAGKFIIKTNSPTIRTGDMIAAYNNYAGTRNEFRAIRNLDIRPTRFDAKPSAHGHVFACILAYMVKKTLERELKEHNLNYTARQALDALEDIKLTVNQLNNNEIKTITHITSHQQVILSALGIDNLPRTME